MNWQPIETAPKDGRTVLVAFECATVDIVHLAWYNSEEEWELIFGSLKRPPETKENFVGWWSYVRGSVTQEKLGGYRTPVYWTDYSSPFGTEQ